MRRTLLQEHFGFHGHNGNSLWHYSAQAGSRKAENNQTVSIPLETPQGDDIQRISKFFSGQPALECH
jgi:hypothetical protein